MTPTANNFSSINEFINGSLLLIDKPLGWTSFDVVNKIKGFVKHTIKIPPNEHGHERRFKIGHAGTLDPLATGLLVICTGALTKQIDHLQAGVKEYTGNIAFGQTTPSYDLETTPEGAFPTQHLNLQAISAAARVLTGELLQRPPDFSAKQVGGQRAYKAARRGERVNLQQVPITVHDFQVLSFESNSASFHITCSKGTYIRSLAHDIGQNLGSGSHLTVLRRVASHPFHVNSAITVEALLERLAKLQNTTA
jgi:tRNA pseudouridine55 synthase